MDRRRFLKCAVASAAVVGVSALGLDYLHSANELRNGAGWTTGDALPFGVADAAAVSYGSRLFVFGGYGRSLGDCRNSVLEFDGDVWSLRSPMPGPCWGPAATVCGGNAYVFGGYPNAIARLYSIANDEWTTLSPMPLELQGQGLMAAAVGTRIYLFFGRAAYEYDAGNDRYIQRMNAPTSRTWATCATVRVENEDRIYVIGGHDNSRGDATNANFYYTPSRDEWSEPQPPAPYSAYGVTRDNPVWMNRIYYGFGHKNPDKFFKEMYSYDPISSEWSRLPPASHERDGVACGMIGEALYVIGGRNIPNNQFGLTYCEALVL